jgi:VWA domain-containing protein
MSHEIGIVLTARFADGDDSDATANVHVRPVCLAPALLPVSPPTDSPMQRTQWPVVAASYEAAIAPVVLNGASQSEATQPSAPPRSAVPNDASAETHVFGVRGRGSRFVYVFDRSSSMEGAPLAAAKRELIASLHSLQANHQFQIIFYNEEPHVMPDFRGRASAMVFANEPGKRLAANFVGSVSPHGSTDHLRALRTALAMRPDVIFLLTDASEPQLSAAELATIRRLNERTTISAIEFGLGSASPQYNFLQQLAAQNGGQHTYVDLLRLLR